MKLGLKFGIFEPPRQTYWWNTVDKFPYLVNFKGKKWEFVMYEDDPTNTVDYILHFGEVTIFSTLYNDPRFEDIEHLIDSNDEPCQCGAIYTSFPWDHMRYCSKWRKL